MAGIIKVQRNPGAMSIGIFSAKVILIVLMETKNVYGMYSSMLMLSAVVIQQEVAVIS